MSVGLGFKKTGVGVIPEDWQVIDMSDLCALQRGFDITEATRIDGTVPVYSSSGLSYRHNRAMVAPPGVVTGRKGILGKVFLVNEPFWPHDTTLWVSDFKNNEPAFVALVLEAFHLERLDAATSVPTLNRNNLAGYRVAIPISKIEQVAIVEALRDADGLIESLEQLLAKKRHLKQGAIQELLTGKRRLPGFSGDWNESRLADNLRSLPDYGINAPGVTDDGTLPAYLRITDIDDQGRLNSEHRVSVRHSLSMNYLLAEGDLVIARTGASVGRSYLYRRDDGPLVFAGFLIRVTADPKKLWPPFLGAVTQTPRYWNWIRMTSMRSGQPGVNANELANLRLWLPPTVKEQVAIAALLSEMDMELTAVEAELAKVRQTKQGMMQELLSGRIRLA